jgi:hypothetical protein
MTMQTLDASRRRLIFFCCRSACAAALLESVWLCALGGASTGGTGIATRGPNETVSAPLAVIVEGERRFHDFRTIGIVCRLEIRPADITVSGSREAVIAPRRALIVPRVGDVYSLGDTPDSRFR